MLGILDTDEPDGSTSSAGRRPRKQSGVARESYLRATRLTASLPEQRYLTFAGKLPPSLVGWKVGGRGLLPGLAVIGLVPA